MPVPFVGECSDPGGKAMWCERNQVGHVIDDPREILEEAMLHGVEVWQIASGRSTLGAWQGSSGP